MRVLAWVAVLGCGRLDFDARSASGDATTSDAQHFDVAPACTNFGPFAPPAMLAVQTPNDDWMATPTRGGLELFWYMCDTSGCHLMHASRASLADPFGAPAQLTELAVGSNQVAPSLTADGLMIVFASDRTGSYHLMWSTRPTPADLFGAPMDLAGTSGGTGVIDRDPALSPDGLRLMFMSMRNSGQGHLFETTRAAITDPFATPVEVTSIEAATQEAGPTLTADGLELFFTSPRGAVGAFDIYHATRASLAQPFGNVQLVPELSSPMDDQVSAISGDGATVYLNYDTVFAGGANAALDTATRGCQ